MKPRQVFGVTLLVLMLWPASSAWAQEPSIEALRIWESVITAKGGHERLRAIQGAAIAQRSVLSDTGQKPTVAFAEVTVAVWGTGLWEWRETKPAGAPRRQALRVLSSNDLSTIARQIEMEELQAVFFCETAAVRPMVLRLDSATVPNAVVIVASTPLLPVVRYTVHVPSHTVLSVEVTRPADRTMSQTERVVTYRFDGVATVDGVKVPIRVSRETLAYALSFVINPDIDPVLFEPATEQHVKPESWGLHLRSRQQVAKEFVEFIHPASHLTYWYVSGDFSNLVRGSGGITAFVYPTSSRYIPWIGGWEVAARVGSGGLTVAGGRGFAGFFGYELLGTVTRTWPGSANATPNATYAGGELAGSLAFIRASVGFSARITEGPADRRTMVTWSIGALVPFKWWKL